MGNSTMGVKFMNSFMEQYPMCFQTFYVDEELLRIDTLDIDNYYIDLTPILHNNLLENPNIFKGFYLASEWLIKYTFRMVEGYVSYIQPNRLIYIALDGIPPAIKLDYQKRRRKYVQKTQERKRKIIYNHYEFTSANITPGTEFMKRLITYFEECLEKKRSSIDHWKNVKIIFSHSSIPGPGEWKIINTISGSAKFDSKGREIRHLVQGFDKQVLFIALNCNKNKLLLSGPLRYDLDQRKFSTIDILTLRQVIEQEFAFLKEIPGFKYNKKSLFLDFTLLETLKRFTFLPHLKELEHQDIKFSSMLSVYKKVLRDTKKYIYQDKINIPQLEILCQELLKMYYALVPPKTVESTPSGLSFQKDKKQKEKTSFLYSSANRYSVEEYAEQYIIALHWVMHYIQGNIISWSWRSTIPFLCSRLENLYDISYITAPTFELGEPREQNEYLLEMFSDRDYWNNELKMNMK
ncbi:XRN 5'-3' exonuclease N-terminus-domain-containing protein [Spinellus fusiger]|nr:XRN 5'-3' exonuclease N-terminus-domain-containing protein [Spinellus fusiger]